MFAAAASSNTGGGTWDGTEYTVPVTGEYLIVSNIRFTDSSAAREIYHTVHVSAAESGGRWENIGSTGTRRGSQNIRRVNLTAGMKVRLAFYNAGTAVALNAGGNGFIITLIGALNQPEQRTPWQDLPLPGDMTGILRVRATSSRVDVVAINISSPSATVAQYPIPTSWRPMSDRAAMPFYDVNGNQPAGALMRIFSSTLRVQTNSSMQNNSCRLSWEIDALPTVPFS